MGPPGPGGPRGVQARPPRPLDGGGCGLGSRWRRCHHTPHSTCLETRNASETTMPFTTKRCYTVAIMLGASPMTTVKSDDIGASSYPRDSASGQWISTLRAHFSLAHTLIPDIDFSRTQIARNHPANDCELRCGVVGPRRQRKPGGCSTPLPHFTAIKGENRWFVGWRWATGGRVSSKMPIE